MFYIDEGKGCIQDAHSAAAILVLLQLAAPKREDNTGIDKPQISIQCTPISRVRAMLVVTLHAPYHLCTKCQAPWTVVSLWSLLCPQAHTIHSQRFYRDLEEGGLT